MFPVINMASYLLEEHKQTLLEVHKGKWTSFQYKLWAEMLVCGTHTSVDEPPSASMFNRESGAHQVASLQTPH